MKVLMALVLALVLAGCAAGRGDGGSTVAQEVGLTRFREPIRVKRSSSVKGVEDGQDRQALLA
jgi:hypothetical protein